MLYGTFDFIAVNLAEPADVLEFLVDGVLLATGPGVGSGDSLVSFFTPGAAGVIPPGRHRVQLRFRKDFSGADAAIRSSTGLPFDGALIDDIKFTPDNNFEAFDRGASEVLGHGVSTVLIAIVIVIAIVIISMAPANIG